MVRRAFESAAEITAALLAAVLLLSLMGCAAGPTRPSDEEAAVPPDPPAGALLAIRNARIPMDGVLSGGQPTPGQIEAAARAGFGTVINLRADPEPGFEWEPATVERLGMRYVSIPVAGADGLTRENVELLDTALKDSRSRGPVLLHCASGNRIGALLALREAWLYGADPDSALDLGLAAGLTRLEARTRELLGLTP